MTNDQQHSLENLVKAQRNLGQTSFDYWLRYSNLETWQFWFNLFLLVAPFVVLYFAIDRKRAFQIGFYGFNVHVWFSYIDAYGSINGLWAYPFRVVPFLPLSVTLNASLVPVAYMLVYQWTSNRKMNYYLFASVLSCVFAFLIKPIMSWLDLFKMYQWMNYFYLFIGYSVIMLLSKWITDFFSHLQNKQGNKREKEEKETSKLNRWKQKGRLT